MAKAKRIPTPKIISDPVHDAIFDIGPMLPMVETPQFQSLTYKHQLGMNYLVFPSATHTRRAHSFGAYYLTTLLTKRWLDLGFITEARAEALNAFALYHDIGHPPFSHVTEPLCPMDNDGLGQQIILTLQAEIEAAGVDFELFRRLFFREDPLYAAVHDKNLGTEKLDYLARDGFFTILSRPSGINYLREHVYFVNGELAVDEKAIDNARDVQDFYIKMYKNVYLRKISVIAQRMLQKMVFGLIAAGELTSEELSQLNDLELLGKFSSTKTPLVQEMHRNLMKRRLFKEAVVIRLTDRAYAGRAANKPVRAFTVSDEVMGGLMKSPALQVSAQESLANLEEEVCQIAGLPSGAVLVVPVFSPERFYPQDIKIWMPNAKLDSMRTRYPSHFKAMEETARAYTALRVCTSEDYRKKLTEPKIAQHILDLLLAKT